MTIKPNLFLLGAPKCGTTSMMHYLSEHPSIFVSAEKEPHYFNTDSARRYYFDEDIYLSLFENASNDHQYRCEGSVWYLYSEVAVDNIEQFTNDVKYIVMLRNPTDLFFSLHQELLYGGSENELSAIKAWNLQFTREKGKKIPLGCSDPKLLLYGKACKLGEQVDRLLKKIPRDRVHFIVLDEMMGKEDMIYNKTLEFLGVPKYHLESYQIINKKKVRIYQGLSRLLITLSRLKKFLGLSGGFGIANRINKLNVSHDVALPKEDQEELRKELYEYFRTDANLLEELTGKDLSHWKYRT